MVNFDCLSLETGKDGFYQTLLYREDVEFSEPLEDARDKLAELLNAKAIEIAREIHRKRDELWTTTLLVGAVKDNKLHVRVSMDNDDPSPDDKGVNLVSSLEIGLDATEAEKAQMLTKFGRDLQTGYHAQTARLLPRA